MRTSTIKNIRRGLYGVIRYAPSPFMERFRSLFFRWVGVAIGKNVRIAVGAMIDVWEKNVPCELCANVSIGENSVISGGVRIGSNTTINSNVSISASRPSQIIIGDDCLIAQNVVIRSDDHRFDDAHRLIREQGKVGGDIKIEDDCWLGANVVILKGVHLGAHTVVGAGSIVTKSFSAYSVIVGNPARLIRSREID